MRYDDVWGAEGTGAALLLFAAIWTLIWTVDKIRTAWRRRVATKQAEREAMFMSSNRPRW